MKKIKIFVVVIMALAMSLTFMGCEVTDNSGTPSPTKYTVRFDTDGGSKIDDLDEVEQNSKIAKPADPTKTGYIFGGWALKDGTLFNFEVDTVDSAFTLYAKWTIKEFTVTFDVDGGSTLEPIKTNYNTYIDVPTTTKLGFDIEGWYRDADFKTAHFFSQTMITEDITLYVKWTVSTHNVSFETGCNDKVSSVKALYGKKIKKPTDPIKLGFDLKGWYKDEDFLVAFDFEIETITENITLYAKWEIAVITVTFNSNGGSSVESAQFLYSENTPEPTAPTKVGFKFDGWYTDEECTSAYNFNRTITKNSTLHAKWVRVFSITFDSKGGDNIASVTDIVGGKIDEPAEPTKSLMSFDGWFTDEEFTSPFNFHKQTIAANYTLYAKWVTASAHNGLKFMINNDEESYAVKSESVSIIGVIDIPAFYKGFAVNCIANSGFKGCVNITSVIVPSSILILPGNSFEDCSSLATVTLPSTLATISDYSFYNCLVLETINMPTSLTEIGDSAFARCAELPSFIVPNSVVKFGKNVFSQCSKLTSITLPDAFTTIPSGTFYQCKSLENFTMPTSLTEVGYAAFDGCEKLASVELPQSVTKIGRDAFSGCKSLTTFDLPSKLTEISDYMFSSCWALTNVTIPSNITKIGDRAFQSCIGLTEITIPSSVTDIGEGAFHGCVKLSNITIPSSVKNVGKTAFSGFGTSQTIHFKGRASAPESWVEWNNDCPAIICFSCEH